SRLPRAASATATPPGHDWRVGVRSVTGDGASRTRTGDLLGAIQALFQLSYSPARDRVAGPLPAFGRARGRFAGRPQPMSKSSTIVCPARTVTLLESGAQPGSVAVNV